MSRRKKKELMQERTADDAPSYIKDWHDRNVWAYGYNDFLRQLLRLVPKDKKRGGQPAMKAGNGSAELTAQRLGAFLLTAHPKSHIWATSNGYMRRASLEVHGMAEFAKPVVTLKSRD